MKGQFLRQVAEKFAGKSPADLGNYTFVFPNRRSSLFFLKYLGELAGKPVFSPRVYTIDKLFEKLTDLEVIDDLSLIFRLWKVYCQVQTGLQVSNGFKKDEVNLEEMDDFFSWGRIILSDFTDVDNYMVDPEQLFTNVKEWGQLRQDDSFLNEAQKDALRKLVEMRSGIGEKDRTKKKYFEIWDMLLPMYRQFKASLAQDGVAYRAMVYRQVAEDLKRDRETEARHILSELGNLVFVGFSAPTECEKVLMRQFKDPDGKGYFYWDYYSPMLKAPQNRSSHLISKCVEEFKCIDPLDDAGGVEENRCTFSIIPAEGSTEQAMIASGLIEDGDGIDTAVVVSDDVLLLPLLEVLKPSLNINVTMGYPMKATSAASFVFGLFALSLRSRKTEKGLLLPGDVLLSLLNHPYLKELDSGQTLIAADTIRKTNSYMLDSGELEKDGPLMVKEDSKLARLLHRIVPCPGEFEVNATVEHFRQVADILSESISSTERAFLNKFLEILERVAASGIVFKKEKSLYSVIKNAIKSQSVVFSGEPLSGVQIMGPLETRSLDFDKIIFLSFNEGTYPATGEQSSSVPYFLRKAFGLPTYENENSISAYNFYRLIQRAKEVYMIYDTANTDSMRSKEESRFIKQLVYDFGITPEYRRYDFPVPSAAEPFTSDIVLTDEERGALGNFFSDLCPKDAAPRYFSASSLNSYIDCKRKFFISKVMRIREEDSLTDMVEVSDYGNIFHYCMQHIYDGYRMVKCDSSLMEKIRARVETGDYLDRLLLEAFGHEMNVRIIEGQNLIIRESVKKYIRNTVESDCMRARNNPFIIEGNEYPIGELDLGEDLLNACVTGSLDRVELSADGQVPRIADYKTGQFISIEKGGLARTLENAGFTSADPSGHFPSKPLEEEGFDSVLEKMFAPKRDKYHSILFQLFMYALMYSKRSGRIPPMDLTVYQLRLLKKCGPLTLRISERHLDMFRERLLVLLKEIRAKALTPGSVMEVCPDTDACKYCDFNIYCRRARNE
ncbi:MAG: PD-(D/E)XK nuclease family protein [Bacteroidales bacterium]|nr:PD-(D/E)XK nuclease family protein [Bacteroidales bacterium]